MAEPTANQLMAFTVVERVTSVFSLVGTSFILLTFVSSRRFHKPINRLVFYASFGNMISNIATLISTSGPDSGVESSLCQFQGFVIQMFLPADALWAMAMAYNVYLTFFRKYNETQLRAMEIKYFILCYGLPAVPAFIYLGLRTNNLGMVYGNAVLWCWVGKSWDALRVATFYGPVWVVMLATFTIYAFAGIEIYQKRKQLVDFLHRPSSPVPPLIVNPFTSTKTTEVKITREAIEPSRSDSPSDMIESAPPAVDGSGEPAGRYQPYSITIEGNPPTTTALTRATQATTIAETNRAAWGYARCAFFFFVVMLITWIPSSVNRVYGLVHPTQFSFALNFVAALVLPLQGFWNSVIYIMTSLPACRSLWYQLRGTRPPPRQPRGHTMSTYGKLGAAIDLKPSVSHHSSRSSSHLDVGREGSQRELAPGGGEQEC
ncbi:MAG: hypothetical protein M1838_005702 [Thelocarpon superellum]|nr:MAG: hypothetical protein M1838_005702 [Thelocarpon superellum]